MTLTQITEKGIKDGEIINADINASAAIAGSKIAPDFGSQNVVTTGTLGSGNFTITGTAPSLFFTESDANPDYQLLSNSGVFKIHDVTNSADRYLVASSGMIHTFNGTASFSSNLDVGAGLDVTGDITSTGNLTITNTQPKIFLTDSNNTSDFSIQNENGNLNFYDETNAASRVRIIADGKIGIGTTSPTEKLDVQGSIRCNTGTDISMDSSASGQVRFRGNGYTGAIALNDDAMHIYSNASSRDLVFGVNASEKMRIDTSGNVGIGTTSPSSLLNVNTPASGSTTAIEISRTTHGTVGKFINSTGALEIQSNKQLILSSDPAQGMTAAGSLIQFLIDGSEKARMSSSGGIAFNGDTANANHLDDYEEGTWTPVLKSGSNTISYSGGSPTFRYTKIGNMVYLNFTSGGTTTSGTTGGDFAIEGLPFTSISSSRHIGSIINNWGAGMQLTSNFVYIHLNSGHTTIHPYSKSTSSSGGNYGHVQVTGVGNSTHMQWSLVYQAA